MSNPTIEATSTVSIEADTETAMLNTLADLLVRQTEVCLAIHHDFAELYSQAFLQEYERAEFWTACPEIAQTAVGARLLAEIEWSRLILTNDLGLLEPVTSDDDIEDSASTPAGTA